MQINHKDMTDVRLGKRDYETFAKQGWSVFDDGSDLLCIQRIDDAQSWCNDYEVPQLVDDVEAWKLAEKQGFVLNSKGYILARLRN